MLSDEMREEVRLIILSAVESVTTLASLDSPYNSVRAASADIESRAISRAVTESVT